jgi:hypothetical protein
MVWVQAIRSAAVNASCSQTALIVNSRDGNRPSPVCCGADPVLDPGVGVPADQNPHPLRPPGSGEPGQQPGQLGDLRHRQPPTHRPGGFAGGVDRDRPGGLRQYSDGVFELVGEGEPDREVDLQAALFAQRSEIAQPCLGGLAPSARISIDVPWRYASGICANASSVTLIALNKAGERRCSPSCSTRDPDRILRRRQIYPNHVGELNDQPGSVENLNVLDRQGATPYSRYARATVASPIPGARREGHGRSATARSWPPPPCSVITERGCVCVLALLCR